MADRGDLLLGQVSHDVLGVLQSVVGEVQGVVLVDEHIKRFHSIEWE